jgi:transposase
MSYSLSQAAKATGKSKATIHRDLNSGKISGERIDSVWNIDPAELHRVYAPVSRGEPERTVSQPEPRNKKERSISLEQHAFVLEQLAERDETISDLRTRLDRSEERQMKLLALLTPPPKPPLWRRLFG